MSRTYTQLLTHVVFSTKERVRLIAPEIRAELHAYLGGLTRELKGKAYSVNGTEDHVHMLVSLPPVVSISDPLRFLKSNSSGWIHEKWPHRGSFAWQLCYGAFSVSQSAVHEVVQYIHDQENHHRKMTFQEELIAFLKKHEIDYDPRYIWD